MSVPPSISVQRSRERRRSASRAAVLAASCCSLPCWASLCSTAASMAPRLRLVFGARLGGAAVELLQVLVQAAEQLQQLLALFFTQDRDRFAARLIGDLPHACEHRPRLLAQE